MNKHFDIDILTHWTAPGGKKVPGGQAARHSSPLTLRTSAPLQLVQVEPSVQVPHPGCTLEQFPQTVFAEGVHEETVYCEDGSQTVQGLHEVSEVGVQGELAKEPRGQDEQGAQVVSCALEHADDWVVPGGQVLQAGREIRRFQRGWCEMGRGCRGGGVGGNQ